MLVSFSTAYCCRHAYQYFTVPSKGRPCCILRKPAAPPTLHLSWPERSCTAFNSVAACEQASVVGRATPDCWCGQGRLHGGPYMLARSCF